MVVANLKTGERPIACPPRRPTRPRAAPAAVSATASSGSVNPQTTNIQPVHDFGRRATHESLPETPTPTASPPPPYSDHSEDYTLQWTPLYEPVQHFSGL